MKEKMREIISKEELKWLSKNVKIKPNYSKCTNCPFGILRFKKNMHCAEMLEKAFDIKLNRNCKEINRTIYYLLNGNKQNKI